MNVIKSYGLVCLFLIASAFGDENKNAIPAHLSSFLNKYCIACHGPKKQKADFRVDSLKFIKNASQAEEWQLVLDNLHLQDMPPEDEPQPSLKERTSATDWIEEELKRARKALKGHTGEVVLRRLNRFEYQNTIKDLFDIQQDYTTAFPEDAKEDGFDNNGAALMLSAKQIEAYLYAAEKIIDVSISLTDKPKFQQKSVSLHAMNKVRWFKTEQGLKAKKRNFKKLTPKDKKKFFEAEAKFKKNPYWQYVFPAVKDGKLAFPTPNDPDGTEYALHKKNFFFLNPTSNDIFKVKEAGWYKFTIDGYAKHTKGESIRVKVGYGALRLKAVVPKIAGYAFLEEDKPQKHSFEVFLQPGEFFRIEEVSNGVRKISDDDLNGYVGPFSVIRSLSFEGPRYNNWPRKGHQTIFGNIDPNQLDRTKVESILSSIAPKLFRRSISKNKIAKYMSLYDTFAKQEKSLDALKSTLQTMMVSPDFLYHYEGKDKVDDYALASRLSYFLWRSTPDNQLLNLASSNKLSQPKILDQQVKRLLKDSRSKRFIKDFVGQWLQINKIGEMRPSRELYPEYDEQLEQAMIEETYGFITEVFEKNLSIDNFIDSDWTILNERLAKLYRIKGIKGLQFRKVKLDKANTVRGGLLTQASVLNVTSNGTTTSPVIRGVWMLDHFLGTPSPPPPPDVPPIEPDIRGATTIKEQLAKHREIETCSACHKKIDPYGVALENFDVIGGWRNRYRALKPGKKKKQVLSSGKQVEAFDAIPGVGKYKDFKEFRSIIMDNKQLVHHNIAHKLATFALGRSLDFSDRDHLHHVVKNSLKKGNGFRTMITELVLNPIFTKP